MVRALSWTGNPPSPFRNKTTMLQPDKFLNETKLTAPGLPRRKAHHERARFLSMRHDAEMLGVTIPMRHAAISSVTLTRA